MKIGIITIHIVSNYGAILQAFALKKAIEINFDDVEVEVIDYRSKWFQKAEKIVFNNNIKQNLIALERVLLKRSETQRWNSYNRFIKLNDSLSPFREKKEDLIKLVNNYDIVISGSDQIWNPEVTAGDMNYFLGFSCPHVKKISYASSLGGYRISKENKQVIEYLKQYSNLSCREISGAEHIQMITGKKCENVCDPTLLLTKEDYLNFEGSLIRNSVKKKCENKYLLIYSLSYDADIIRKAKEIAKERKLKIYAIFSSYRYSFSGIHTFIDCSVEEFCYLFANADFIITNSFHGSCFSIINKKDFITIRENEPRNERIQSLFSKLDLLDRFEIKHVVEANICKSIDYRKVDENLNAYRKKSIEYLVNAITEEK